MGIKYIDLSPRENEVYLLILKGKTNYDIASELNVSRCTVATHVVGILNKKCCSSKVELLVERIKELEDVISELRNNTLDV